MRYVDNERLRLEPDWHDRADAALNDLREEIRSACAEAHARGEDVYNARREAIARGLAVAGRQRIWRDVSALLAEISWEKCWYSESRNPGSDKNVDHFRPKGSVKEDSGHDGYWWLAFDWRNFRYSSQWCNQRRNDRINDTKGGKGDRFPLCPGSSRARHEGDRLEEEEPMLLDPSDPEDWKLLGFRTDGHPTPVRPAGTIEHERALVSIDIYHLHCKPLVDDRREVASRVRRVVETLEQFRRNIAEHAMRVLYKRELQELYRLIDKRAEYSSAALCYARGEVYKLEQGEQIKRSWLEEVLDANP